jgi:hypothetical protein
MLLRVRSARGYWPVATPRILVLLMLTQRTTRCTIMGTHLAGGQTQVVCGNVTV